MSSDVAPDVSALAINVTIPEGLRWTDTRRGEEFTLTTLNVRLLPDGRLAAKAYGRPTGGGRGAYVSFPVPNRPELAAGEPVSLDLYVKNVETLIVKVFEINTENFYRQNLKEVSTDVNLDGLVANQETTYRYQEPPLRWNTFFRLRPSGLLGDPKCLSTKPLLKT